MKKQLLTLLEKANKLEDKFRSTKWESCKTHAAECKLSNDKDNSRKLRKTLEEALFLLESLEGEH